MFVFVVYAAMTLSKEQRDRERERESASAWLNVKYTEECKLCPDTCTHHSHFHTHMWKNNALCFFIVVRVCMTDDVDMSSF